MKYFVHADKSIKLEQTKEAIEVKRKILHSVAAKEISPCYAEKLNKGSSNCDIERMDTEDDSAENDAGTNMGVEEVTWFDD